MHIHFFSHESSYSSAFLDIVKSEINLDEHLFVFGFAFIKFKKKQYDYGEQLNKRVVRLKNPLAIFSVWKQIKKSKWLYLHLLSYDPTLLFWRMNLKLLDKATWIIWGTDVYAYNKKDDNIKTRFYESLRRKIIPRFREIAAFVKEDADLVKQVYQSDAEYIPIAYPNPVSIELLQSVRVNAKNEFPVFLLGNSADVSNNHIEMLQILAKFKNERLKIYCPLSYGGNKEYIAKVIDLGHQLFGDSFVPLKEYLNTTEYASILAEVDISLMNHNRQQGLGNILALLFLEKKVFLKSNISSYYFFQRKKLVVYDIATITNMTFEELVTLNNELKANKQIVKSIIGKESILPLWVSLFNRHECSSEAAKL